MSLCFYNELGSHIWGQAKGFKADDTYLLIKSTLSEQTFSIVGDHYIFEKVFTLFSQKFSQ